MESVFVTRREGIISNIFWETMLDEIKKNRVKESCNIYL